MATPLSPKPPEGAEEAWASLMKSSAFLNQPFQTVWQNADSQNLSKPICRALLRCASDDQQPHAWLAATVVTLAAKNTIFSVYKRHNRATYNLSLEDLQVATWITARSTNQFKFSQGKVVAKRWKQPLFTLVMAAWQSLLHEEVVQQCLFPSPVTQDNSHKSLADKDLTFVTELADCQAKHSSTGSALQEMANRQSVSVRTVQRRRKGLEEKLTEHRVLRSVS